MGLSVSISQPDSVFQQGQYNSRHSVQQRINAERTHNNRWVSPCSPENNVQTSPSCKADSNNENNKSLLSRKIKTLNRLLAISVGTGGSAVAAGVGLLNPVNLAMAATQYATGTALKSFPDSSRIQTTAEYVEKAARIGQ